MKITEITTHTQTPTDAKPQTRRAPLLALLGCFAMVTIATPALASGNDDDDSKCQAHPRSEWMATTTLSNRLKQQGYQIRNVKVEGNCYEVYGINRQGQRVEMYFDTKTGQMVKSEIDD